MIMRPEVSSSISEPVVHDGIGERFNDGTHPLFTDMKDLAYRWRGLVVDLFFLDSIEDCLAKMR